MEMDCAQDLKNYILQITVNYKRIVLEWLTFNKRTFPPLFPEVRTWGSLTSKRGSAGCNAIMTILTYTDNVVVIHVIWWGSRKLSVDVISILSYVFQKITIELLQFNDVNLFHHSAALINRHIFWFISGCWKIVLFLPLCLREVCFLFCFCYGWN